MAPFPSNARNAITQPGGEDPDSAGLNIAALPKKRRRSSSSFTAMAASPFSIPLLPQRQLLRFVPPFHPTFPFPSSSPSPGNLMINSGSFDSFDRHTCCSSERDLHQQLSSLSSSAASLVLSTTIPSSSSSSSPLHSLLSLPDASLSACPADIPLFVDESLPDVAAAAAAAYSCLQTADLQEHGRVIDDHLADDVDDPLTSLPRGDLQQISPTATALDPEFKEAHCKNEAARPSSWKQAKLYRYATKPQFAHGREDLRRYNSRRSERCRANQICKAYARGRDSSLSAIQLCNNYREADKQHSTSLRVSDAGEEGEKENISSPLRALQISGNSSSLTKQHPHSNTSSSSTSPRRRLPIFEQICPSAQ